LGVPVLTESKLLQTLETGHVPGASGTAEPAGTTEAAGE